MVIDLTTLPADRVPVVAEIPAAALDVPAEDFVVQGAVTFDGEIVRDDSTDPKVNGTRAGLRMLGEDPRFDATALQTVGIKGWDGIALALVV